MKSGYASRTKRLVLSLAPGEKEALEEAATLYKLSVSRLVGFWALQHKLDREQTARTEAVAPGMLEKD